MPARLARGPEISARGPCGPAKMACGLRACGFGLGPTPALQFEKISWQRVHKKFTTSIPYTRYTTLCSYLNYSSSAIYFFLLCTRLISHPVTGALNVSSHSSFGTDFFSFSQSLAAAIDRGVIPPKIFHRFQCRCFFFYISFSSFLCFFAPIRGKTRN